MKNLQTLKDQIKHIALEQGFQQSCISDINTNDYFPKFKRWVLEGFHGEMSYLQRNQSLRENPEQLLPETCRVISFRYNYLPKDNHLINVLEDQNLANISRYALGRDYHKLMRKKLQLVARRISLLSESLNYRVFVDSAPVLETSYAEKSGLGWQGKHTLIINKKAGSWFFLGEIFINLPLPIDPPAENLCGNCSACINLCPTQAIVAPYKVDARRCISYLTIENQSSIPLELREKIGNKIYGCDDCQLVCPWNRFAKKTQDKDFFPRNGLDSSSLLKLFNWSENEFYSKLEGSPIRRIGYQNWLRNLAVALGNSDTSNEAVAALEGKKLVANTMVNEHIGWAIEQLTSKQEQPRENAKQKMKLIHATKKIILGASPRIGIEI